MKNILYVFIVLLALSCGNKREISETPQPESPVWVQNRPLNPTYYTGIGIAPKTTGTNYQAAAKKNALSDLASEIKVNVNTNSLLYTLEDKSNFEQEFRESIQTSSDLDLEDFEIVDTWQDTNSYWVYYRLSKAAYAEALRQKKEAAQELALDFLAKADAATDVGNFSTAADYYLRGLQALEKFWNDENRVDYSGRNILLDNTLFTNLQDLLKNVEITCLNSIEINFQNRYTTLAEIKVQNQNGHLLENVPLVFGYYGTYGRLRNNLKSNSDGRVEVQVVNADKTRPDNTLKISVDVEQVFAPFQSDNFMRKLTQTMTGANSQIPIVYKAPVVYLECNERNLGKRMDTNPLQAAITTSLNRHGLRLSANKGEADLILIVDSDTNKSGTSNGFFSAQLTVNLSVKDKISGEDRYQISRSDVKGVDLTYEKAGLKAYYNLTGNIESELMRPIVNDLF